jgi:pimeloyl-ACP methyl ester carboxylesterase
LTGARAWLGTSSFYATIDGVRLHWTERGAGPPLIILHGLADSQHTWGIVASKLASRYRVLSLDLPGCGLSARPNANYTIDWQARLIARWLDSIGISTFDVLGHSYGGGVALWLLLYVPYSMRKLALIAPGGLGDEVAPLLRLAAVMGVCERGGQWVMGPITRLLANWYGHSLTRAERQALERMNGSPGSARAFARTVRDVISWRGQTRRLAAGSTRFSACPRSACSGANRIG